MVNVEGMHHLHCLVSLLMEVVFPVQVEVLAWLTQPPSRGPTEPGAQVALLQPPVLRSAGRE